MEYRVSRGDLSGEDAAIIDSDPSMLPLLIRLGAIHVRAAARSEILVLADIERCLRSTLDSAVSRIKDTVETEIRRNVGTDEAALEAASNRISGDVCKTVMALSAKIDADPTAALVSETMRSVQSIRDKLLPSRDKGCIGEMLIGDLLATYFPEAEIDDVGCGKSAHSGDFLMRFPGQEDVFLIESKMWDRPCPRSEVDKCYSDMRTKGAQYGLIVSLKSGFAGKSGSWCVERRGSATLVFVGRAAEGMSGVVFAVTCLREMARCSASARGTTGRVRWDAIVREIEEFGEQEKSLATLLAGVRKMISIANDNVEREADKLQRGLKRRIELLRFAVEQEMTGGCADVKGRDVDESPAKRRSGSNVTFCPPAAPSGALSGVPVP